MDTKYNIGIIDKNRRFHTQTVWGYDNAFIIFNEAMANGLGAIVQNAYTLEPIMHFNWWGI